MDAATAVVVIGAVSALVSAAVAALVSVWLGPRLLMRQERMRRGLAARDEIVRALQLLLRQLRTLELQNPALDRRGGQARVSPGIRHYERMLWPVVRALESPDLPVRLSKRLLPLLKELLGSWRTDYLAVCTPEEIENSLEHFPMQPRHLREPISLLERLCGNEPSDPVLAEEAVAKVEAMLRLLR